MKHYRSLGAALYDMDAEGVQPVLARAHDVQDPNKPNQETALPASSANTLAPAGSEPVLNEAGDIVGYVKQGATGVAEFVTAAAPEAASIAQKFAALSTPAKVMVGLLAYAVAKKVF